MSKKEKKQEPTPKIDVIPVVNTIELTEKVLEVEEALDDLGSYPELSKEGVEEGDTILTYVEGMELDGDIEDEIKITTKNELSLEDKYNLLSSAVIALISNLEGLYVGGHAENSKQEIIKFLDDN